MRVRIFLLALVAAAAAVGLVSIDEPESPIPPRFAGLGDLPGGIYLSVAKGVSADGKVVVGYSHSGLSLEAFRWTAATGLQGLGFPYAFATSSDGSAVAGYRYIDDRIEPVRWTLQGRVEGLDPEGRYRDGAAYGISADGRTLVGVVGGGEIIRDTAFRWGRSDELTQLSGLDDPDVRSEAHAVSADGRVIVGAWRSDTGRSQAFRWTAEDGITELGFLPGQTTSVAYGVSADGSVIVGACGDYAVTEAFRWTEETGMVKLETLDADSLDHAAYGVSADGTIVVGRSTTKQGWNAVVWDASQRVRSVRELLVSDGDVHDAQMLHGWQLRCATAVSADGSVVVGFGESPLGTREGWIARLVAVAEVRGQRQEVRGSKVARLGDLASCSVPARKIGQPR